jgi:signal transduction histidine kinase/ABC-type amino acid transport substrate-binding protein
MKSTIPISCWVLLLLSNEVWGQIASPTQKIALTYAEQQFVKDHPMLRLMVDSHFEPADFIDDDGKHSGMAADFLKLLSERTGLQFEPVPLNAEQRAVLDPVKRGVDGVALSAFTPRRAEFYDTTESVLEFPAYMLTRRSADPIFTPLDMNGKKVAVVSGYASEEYLREYYPKLTLVPFATTSDGLKALSFGEVDSMIATVPVSTFWLEQEGFSNLKIGGESGYIYRLGVLSRKDWPELGSILKKGVHSITTEERHVIRTRWLTAPYEPLFRSRRLWAPILAVTTLLLGSLVLVTIWNRLLLRKVNRRTSELAASAALYKTTLENVSDAVLLERVDGTILYASAGVKSVFRRDPAEVMRTSSIADLIGKELAKQASAGTDTVRDLECHLPAVGGGRFVLVTASPVNIRDAVRLYVCHDMTERYRIERQLRQTRTLESVGLLASGVAHDFNNLLQVIGGFTEMAGITGTPETIRQGYLGQVTDATHRAGGLTRQLLAFVRRQPLEKKVVDVIAATKGLLGLSSGLTGKGVQVRFEPPTLPVRVNGDPSQVEQVLLNLLVNARDAMPEGGTITVEWDITNVTDEQAATHPEVKPGLFARLRVSDTGTGIPETIRSKIFEPFFTTKAEGQGTGLGLAVVLQVIRDAGGFVELTTEENIGTTFEAYWPSK